MNRLNPKNFFLFRWISQFDAFLLHHYPAFWRLRIHYVLPTWFAIGASILAIGSNIKVSPFELALNRETGSNTAAILNFCVTIVGVISAFIWRGKVARHAYAVKKWYAPALELLALCICWYVMVNAFIAPGRADDYRKIQSAQTLQPYKEFFVRHNFFIPMYLPHYDSLREERQEDYFSAGELLFKDAVYHPNSLEHRGINNYNQVYEQESRTQHLPKDSLAKIIKARYVMAVRKTGDKAGSLASELPLVVYLASHAPVSVYNKYLESLDSLHTTTSLFRLPYKSNANGQGQREKQLLVYRCFLQTLTPEEARAYYAYLKQLAAWVKPEEKLRFYEQAISASEDIERFKKSAVYKDSVLNKGMMGTYKAKSVIKAYSEGEELYFGISNDTTLWSLNNIGVQRTLRLLNQRNANTKDPASTIMGFDQVSTAGIKSIKPVFDSLQLQFDSLSRSMYLFHLFAFEDEHNQVYDYVETPENKGILSGMLQEKGSLLDTLWLKEYLLHENYRCDLGLYWYGRYLDHYYGKIGPAQMDTLSMYLTTAGISINHKDAMREKLFKVLYAMDSYDCFSAQGRYFEHTPTYYFKRVSSNLAVYWLVFFLAAAFFLLTLIEDKVFNKIVVWLLVFSATFMLSSVDKYLTGTLFKYVISAIVSTLPLLLLLLWLRSAKYQNDLTYVLPISLIAIGWFGLFKLKAFSSSYIINFAKYKGIDKFWNANVIFPAWALLLTVLLIVVAAKRFYPKRS